MIAYRLERNGVGPYQNKLDEPGFNDLLIIMERFHLQSGRHKSWQLVTVFAVNPGSEWLSGCESLEQLKDWFAGFWDELLAFGFKVVEYVTRECVTSKNQLMFIPAQSE